MMLRCPWGLVAASGPRRGRHAPAGLDVRVPPRAPEGRSALPARDLRRGQLSPQIIKTFGPYLATCQVEIAILRYNCAKLGKSQGSPPKVSLFSSRMRVGRAQGRHSLLDSQSGGKSPRHSPHVCACPVPLSLTAFPRQTPKQKPEMAVFVRCGRPRPSSGPRPPYGHGRGTRRQGRLAGTRRCRC